MQHSISGNRRGATHLMPKRERDESPTRLVLPSEKYGEWRNVPGFEAAFVSSKGYLRVFTKRYGPTKPYLPKQETSGYRRVKYNGTCYMMHDLVCRAFHGLPVDNTVTADHLNHDRGDNRPENLRWATRQQQQRNRRKPSKTQRNSKVVLLRHHTWDDKTPSMWFGSTNIAGKAIQRSGASVRQAIRNNGLVNGFTATFAQPTDDQNDLPGEIWKQVGATLRVSSMGRMQTTSNGVWGYKTVATPLDSTDYAIVLVNQRFHRVVYYAFFPETDERLTIDHINRDKSDNRLCNLRAVEWKVQNANRSVPSSYNPRF